MTKKKLYKPICIIENLDASLSKAGISRTDFDISARKLNVFNIGHRLDSRTILSGNREDLVKLVEGTLKYKEAFDNKKPELVCGACLHLVATPEDLAKATDEDDEDLVFQTIPTEEWEDWEDEWEDDEEVFVEEADEEEEDEKLNLGFDPADVYHDEDLPPASSTDDTDTDTDTEDLDGEDKDKDKEEDSGDSGDSSGSSNEEVDQEELAAEIANISSEEWFQVISEFI